MGARGGGVGGTADGWEGYQGGWGRGGGGIMEEGTGRRGSGAGTGRAGARRRGAVEAELCNGDLALVQCSFSLFSSVEEER